MRSALRFLLLGLVAALTFAISPGASGGEAQDLIVTSSWVSSCAGYVVETLTGVVTACRPTPSSWSGAKYAVAADGSIVNSGEQGVGDSSPVLLLRPDGQLLTLDSSPLDFDPSISPDGSKVTFARYEGQPTGGSDTSDIYVVNSDGSGLKMVASGGGTQRLTVPTFAPDGRTIAYACDPGNPQDITSERCGPLMDGTFRNRGLILMNADGSDKRMIVIANGLIGIGDSLSWSPDGQWIATGCGQVFAYRTDGSDLFDIGDANRQVTHVTTQIGPCLPQFTPDGTQIFYFMGINDSGEEGNFSYVMNRDGTDPHQVFLSPDPLTCRDGVCSGHPDTGVLVPSATGRGPAPTVDATHVTVPAVRHLSYHAARRKLSAGHLGVKVAGRHFSRVPRNHVISQSPNAGARVHRLDKQGPNVKLVLSRGRRHHRHR